MKKKSEALGGFYPGAKKLLLIMRLSIFLVLISVLTSTASVYSQTTKLTVKMKNCRIAEVFDAIEQQSEFYFFYNRDNFDDNQLVSINMEGKTVEKILDELLEGRQVNYEIVDKNILIKTKDKHTATSYSQQQKSVSGTVKDASGQTLPGVTVLVKESAQGTITDTNGEFSLSNIPENATLVFSFVGMRTQEVIVGSQSTINVTLEVDAIGLEEVVAVGYGTQKKANLTGAVSTVSLPQMEKRTVAQTSLALQGLVPGVTVTQRSGKPGGDGGIISVRGKTTIGNNDVLVLIDGVESSINSIDPKSIESMSVLKDAASSAIYGNRAANGVILITTKRAEDGKAYISYNSYVAKGVPTNVPKYVGAVDFMKYISIAKRAVGMTPEYSEEYINEYEAGVARNDPNYPDVDWFDATATNNGLITNHFLTISQGTKQIKSLTQAGYMSQNGITENTNYKRYTLRSNTDYNISSKLAVRSDIVQITMKVTT